MDRKQVLPGKSSQIVSIGYDEANKILELEFTSGGVYRYFKFPRELYEEFIRAESLGVFVGTKIRGAFEYKRLHVPECDTTSLHGCACATCWCHKLTKTSRETEKPSEKEKPAKKQKKSRPAI